jgi:hypothetical protein
MHEKSCRQLSELDRFLALADPSFDVQVEANVQVGSTTLPVYSVAIGNPSPSAAAVGYFGGVHGLERIGSEVVLAFMQNIQTRLRWDDLLHRKLENVRLIFMPIVNPGGLLLGTRANPSGVDLMRNAPVDATEPVPFMIGGQRQSSRLPWYRGPAEGQMEPEARALCSVVERELLGHSFSMAMDCHSGFGLHDRVWFPFAHTSQPIEHLPEVLTLVELYAESHAHHRYVFEPQSRQYCAHGDLWDFLYLQARSEPARTFLPLTLEMGSWVWVKKNPRQLFSRHGIFNPLIEHRLQRVLRRHVGLMEFLARAGSSARRWLPAAHDRENLRRAGLLRWYGSGA